MVAEQEEKVKSAHAYSMRVLDEISQHDKIQASKMKIEGTNELENQSSPNFDPNQLVEWDQSV